MTTTADDLISRTKLHLLGNTREEINQIAGDYTAGGGTLTFRYPLASIQAGANVEVDQEVFRVMSVEGLTAHVIGGQLGSSPANHDDATVVTVNPRFYRHSILSDLNNTLSDLDGAGLFQEREVNLTFNPAVSAYDITGSGLEGPIIRILEVRYQAIGPSHRWPLIQEWSLMRDMDLSSFPSGNGLIINSAGGFPGRPLRVVYAVPFTQIQSVTDDLDAIGLPATAQDLPPMGAAVRQMLGRDIKRTFLEAQPDTRRAQEVPPGTGQNAMRSLQQQYLMGIQDEKARQLQRFPYRRAV